MTNETGHDYRQDPNMEVSTQIDCTNIDELLIEEVRNYPWLYDLQRKDNKDHLKKDRTWLDIASSLQRHEPSITKEDLVHRWRLLREKFARERKQYYLGNGGTQRRKWYLYDAMSFLIPYIRHKGRLFRSMVPKEMDSHVILEPEDTSEAEDQLNTSVDINDFKETNETVVPVVTSEEVQPSQPSYINSPISLKRPCVLNNESARRPKLFRKKIAVPRYHDNSEMYTRILTSLRTLEAQDEDDHFAAIVSATLKRLKPINKAKVKLEISKLLLQGEIDQLESEGKEEKTVESF